MSNFFSAKSPLTVFKTGMRVPKTGWYQDQYGQQSYHEIHRTFPPCIRRKGECAQRTFLRP